MRRVVFFSSHLRGEDTGEGDGCRYPLTLALSPKGQWHEVKRGCHCERSEAIFVFVGDCFVAHAHRNDRRSLTSQHCPKGRGNRKKAHICVTPHLAVAFL